MTLWKNNTKNMKQFCSVVPEEIDPKWKKSEYAGTKVGVHTPLNVYKTCTFWSLSSSEPIYLETYNFLYCMEIMSIVKYELRNFFCRKFFMIRCLQKKFENVSFLIFYKMADISGNKCDREILIPDSESPQDSGVD